MKIKVSKRFIAHLDELTEWNNHTERMIEVAAECQKQAGTDYEKDQFRSIRECMEDNHHEHLERGSLTRDLMTIREGLRLLLIQSIKMYFDDESAAVLRP